MNVDAGFAAAIAAKLGAEIPDAASSAVEPVEPVELPASPALSIISNPPATFAGRKLGVLVADGSNVRLIRSLRKAIVAAGATMEVVAPHVGGFTGADGTLHPADHRIDGAPSVLFDAVAIILGDTGAAQLAGHGPAVDFVRDAHAHCKFIGHTPTAAPLLERAGVTPDDAYVLIVRTADTTGFVERCAHLRFWDREPSVFTL